MPIFSHFDIRETMEFKSGCARYVAFLRALYLLHQNHHWLTRGGEFYSKHLMFERLYKSAQDNADLAAEKLIGNFGVEILDISTQPDLIKEYLGEYSSELNVQSCLDAEHSFLEFSQEFYNLLAKENKLSLGLDDAIMSIASNREEAVYLLNQSLDKNMNKINMLANKFKVKLAQTATPTLANFRQKLHTMLSVNLGNRNWGEVGFNSFEIYNSQDGTTVIVKCNILLPNNSPPFVDKNKYPQGLNQFKQELMKTISNFAEQSGITDNLLQIITVNNK